MVCIRGTPLLFLTRLVLCTQPAHSFHTRLVPARVHRGRLRRQWLQCQANGSNVCRVLRGRHSTHKRRVRPVRLVSVRRRFFFPTGCGVIFFPAGCGVGSCPGLGRSFSLSGRRDALSLSGRRGVVRSTRPLVAVEDFGRAFREGRQAELHEDGLCVETPVEVLGFRVQGCGVDRGTSLNKNSAPPGPYSRNMPRAPWWSQRGGLFLMSEVPL